MKVLRLILLVLLSIAIPLEGFAAVPASPCPMRMQATTAATDAAMPDCCDPQHRAAQQKSCKPGQSCSASGFYIALPVSRPSAIWHPPRQS
jgi:hypothetical protein